MSQKSDEKRVRFKQCWNTAISVIGKILTIGDIENTEHSSSIKGMWGKFDKWGRYYPIKFSILAIAIGTFVFYPVSLFVIWIFSATFNIGLFDSIIKHPTAFLSLVLAPYFWVLWIWRHNNTEHSKKRNQDLDEQDRFNRIIDMVGSTEINLRSGGIMLLGGFLDRYETKSEYEYYCDVAISVLANNYFTIGNAPFQQKMMCHKSFAVCLILQNKYYQICEKVARTPLTIDFYANEYVRTHYEFCFDNKQEFVFTRCVIRLDYLLTLLRDQKIHHITSKIKFVESIFLMSEYYLTHQIPEILADFFKNENIVYKCLLSCPNDNLANKEIFEGIEEANDSFVIDSKYSAESEYE